MSSEELLAKGHIERIGLKGPIVKASKKPRTNTPDQGQKTSHTDAVVEMISTLTDGDKGVIRSEHDIAAVGHRIVHAGEKLQQPVVIDEKVKIIIKECSPLAPLHNPPNLVGVLACEKYFPDAPQIAVFDTAFHSTMPPKAFLYGLPHEIYQEYGVRRYGFHGTSHKFVAQRAGDLLGVPWNELKIISCHLGNGCSLAAIKYGASIDTSMGMTPLEGLIMGTRCGDLDPAVILFLMKNMQLTVDQVDNLLNQESGLLGLAGIGSSDLRDIEGKAGQGHEQAIVALETFCYRIKKYIGAYIAAMGGLDVLVFTAGVGTNSSLVRAKVCEDLDSLGISLDLESNERFNGIESEIQSKSSSVKILITPTDEELEIARQAKQVLLGEKSPLHASQ